MLLQATCFLAGTMLAHTYVLQTALSPVYLKYILLILLLSRFTIRRLAINAGITVALGLVWTCIVISETQSAIIKPAMEAKEVVVEGEITSIPFQNPKSVRFEFTITKVQGQAKPLHKPMRVRLSWYTRVKVAAGERWQLNVRLKRPNGSLNPGGFDYEKWLVTHRYAATGYVRSRAENRKLSNPSTVSLSAMRQWVYAQINNHLPASPNRGVIAALTIGEKDAITVDQWQKLTETGTNHLLAISGLHIGIVAGIGYFLGKRLASHFFRFTCRVPAQHIGALFAIGAATFYAGLANFSIPTQRALIMVMVASLASLCYRPIRLSRVLAVSMLLILIHDPLASTQVGFWLSFAAVACIFYTMLGRMGASRWYWQWFRPQWVVALALAPFTLFWFQQASIISPLVNTVAIPWVSMLVVPIALLAVLSGVVSPMLCQWLFTLVDELLTVLWYVLDFFQSLPLANLSQSLPSSSLLWMTVLGMLLLLAPKGTPSRGLSIVFLLPLVLSHARLPQQGELELTLLDVGQGLSVVIRTHQHVLIYDTGPRVSDASDSGTRVLLPFLSTKGIKHIDTLIISHGDNDHIGGTRSLLHHRSVGQILSSVPEKLPKSYPSGECIAGQSWRWDGVQFDILHPRQSGLGDHNNASCVLKVSSPGGSVLLPGDIHRRVEKKLVERLQQHLKADVLVAPHHGSKTSSSRPFIAAVNPKYVLFSVGYKNRFGHPHKQVRDRYQQIQAQMLNSAKHGAITFHITPESGVKSPIAYRQFAGRWWTRPAFARPAGKKLK